MRTGNFDIRSAVKQLQSCGIKTGDQKLRQHLLKLGAIRKTNTGYEVTAQFQSTGLLVTQIRHAHITTEGGRRIQRQYSVVLITDTGCNWLRRQLSTIH